MCEIALENLQERQKELEIAKDIVEQNIAEFRQLLKTRKVELAMQQVPEKIKLSLRNSSYWTMPRKFCINCMV